MTEFERLKPKLPATERFGQCEEPFVIMPGWSEHYLQGRERKINEKGWDINRCNRTAAYKIEGRCLCQQHAAIKALAILERDYGGHKTSTS